MFCKKIEIEFLASTPEFLEILEKPYPAVQAIPDWFRKMSRYVDGEKNIDEYNDPTSTIKKCMPVVDMMGAGYHIPLHSDVWLTNAGEDSLRFKWAIESMDVISFQNPQSHDQYPVPSGYYKSVFKWINPWVVRTPPGWSCLFIHPQHQDPLPFLSLPALVDTDKHPAPINFPFYVRKGFDGLIEKGTPVIQVIPFKREKFKASFSWDKKGSLKKAWDKAHSVFFERYRRFFRSSKSFEPGEIKKESKCPLGF